MGSSFFCFGKNSQDLRQLEGERQREREADRLERLRLEKALEEMQGRLTNQNPNDPRFDWKRPFFGGVDLQK